MRTFLITLAVFLILIQPICGMEAEDSIKIAIIDTGISTKALDQTQIIQGKNYIIQNQNTEDLINHGTAIASLILGKADRGLVGSYPEAILVPLVYYSMENKALVKGDAQMIAQCIYDAVDVFSCRVINLSAGVLIDSKKLKDACEYAETMGVVIVSAVGNDNQVAPKNLYYPAAYDTVIGVGALNESFEVAEFSQRNSSVSLLASGENLWVARASGKMTYVSGTSYSCAFISATVARILEENPELTPAEVRKILYETANDLGEVGYDIENGYGELNTQKAMELAKNFYLYYDILKYIDIMKETHRLGFINNTDNTKISPNLSFTKARKFTIVYRMAY